VNVRDENALIFSLFSHIDPCLLCDGKYVWTIIVSPFVTILLYDRVGVQRQLGVRIDGDKKQTRISLRRACFK
jgi:hypothetical protein